MGRAAQRLRSSHTTPSKFKNIVRAKACFATRRKNSGGGSAVLPMRTSAWRAGGGSLATMALAGKRHRAALDGECAIASCIVSKLSRTEVPGGRRSDGPRASPRTCRGPRRAAVPGHPRLDHDSDQQGSVQERALALNNRVFNDPSGYGREPARAPHGPFAVQVLARALWLARSRLTSKPALPPRPAEPIAATSTTSWLGAGPFRGLHVTTCKYLQFNPLPLSSYLKIAAYHLPAP